MRLPLPVKRFETIFSTIFSKQQTLNLTASWVIMKFQTGKPDSSVQRLPEEENRSVYISK